MNSYKDILKKFSIITRNYELYEQAFSHSSFVHESKEKHIDYERIEFMGDAVLDLVVADLIFKNHPAMPQGDMTKLRSKLVKRESLASYARKYEFWDAIYVGNSLKQNGQDLDKILEDVFEAFIGAVYIDQGFGYTYELIRKIFIDDVLNYSLEELTDYKSKLQEYVQADTRNSVTYRLVSESGSAQDKEFVMEVMWEDNVWGRGRGSSKKKAEQDAARDALNKVAR